MPNSSSSILYMCCNWYKVFYKVFSHLFVLVIFMFGRVPLTIFGVDVSAESTVASF